MLLDFINVALDPKMILGYAYIYFTIRYCG